MSRVLGKRIGLLSNFMIFLHTFTATISVWLFSFEFLMHAAKNLFLDRYDKEFQEKVEMISMYSFFAVVMILLYLSSIADVVYTLKKISMVGLLIIIYCIIVFTALLPTYYDNYKDDIEFNPGNFDSNVFVTSGICFYLFLN